MDQGVTQGAGSVGQFYGAMIVDTTINRLDAQPVNNSKSILWELQLESLK